MAKARTVVESPRFEREVDSLGFDREFFDEVMLGVVWMLARNPGRGLQHGNVWAFPFPDVLDQSMTIYYAFNEHRVILLSLR